MQSALTDDLSVFTASVGSWLAQSPVENNVLLSAIAAQRAGQAKGARPATFGWVSGGAEILGALRWPPPLPATMTAMPGPAARLLADTLAAQPAALPGVNGPAQTVACFAARWQEATGQVATQERELLLSGLTEVKLAEWPPGRLRLAAPGEAGMLVGWIAQVFAEAGLAGAEQWARQQITEQLSDGRLYVWEDHGEPVAVTGHAAPVDGVALIHGGFTPPEHRTSWYGTAVVAAVSALLLEQGCTTCIGITDNSNRYAAPALRMVGYSAVLELTEYRFGPSPSSR
ncbi:MAG TPA: GNAT family N-acetyltransferase [Streptosporangiaceae bacterium]|nr:GNAT family N-acetyltransferase [Streptosporangiaceae bacterium]